MSDRAKAWKVDNRERNLARDRAYTAAHPEIDVAYQRENADAIRVRRAARHATNRTADNARQAEWRMSNPPQPGRQRASRHRMTVTEIDELYQAQDGRCAICRTPAPITGPGCLLIDHDHATDERRGLVCGPCNAALAALDRFGVAWIESVTSYLSDPPLRRLRRRDP